MESCLMNMAIDFHGESYRTIKINTKIGCYVDIELKGRAPIDDIEACALAKELSEKTLLFTDELAKIYQKKANEYEKQHG